MIWSTWARKHTDTHAHNCMLHCPILIWLDLERKRSTAALSKEKSYLVVSTHTLGPVHLRRGGDHF